MKAKMRKIYVFILTLCIFSVYSLNAQAYSDTEIISISPYLTYTSSTYTNISISSSGVATGTASITGYQGTTTKVSVYMYLQQYSGGSWKTITSWLQNFENYKGTLEKSFNVSKGYKYRILASYYAYSGGNNENTTSYSGESSY